MVRDTVGVFAREIQPSPTTVHCRRANDATIHEPRPTLFQQLSNSLGAFGRNGVSIDVSALIRMPRNLFRDLLRKFRRTNAYNYRAQLAQPTKRSGIL